MRLPRTTRPRPLAVALALCAALLLGGIGSTTATGASGPVAETAKKKKCKKGKKGAAAAKKKCGKKGKKKPVSLGPSLPIGEWACLNSGMQTLAGNRYTINRTDPGNYKYFPDTGVVQFIGGSYAWAYGIYYPSAEAIEIYSNDASVTPIGTYGWTCSKLSP